MRGRRNHPTRVLVLLVGLLGVICWGLLRTRDERSVEDVGFNVNIAWDVAGDLSKADSGDTLQWEIHKSASRQLLGLPLPNCTPRAVEQFPHDLFNQQQRRQGAIIIHLVIVIYMFLALAIVCDDYFVPSLEVICELLNLQTDVAGATFMAAGSSAPELATSIIGVFVAKDDVGVGTVVGSAIYNVMFVIAVCGLVVGPAAVNLHWWPMVRDCLAYLISVAALVVVIYDNIVRWYEALTLVALYAVYIVLMYFNRRLEGFFVPRFSCCCPDQRDLSPEAVSMYDKLGTPNGTSHPPSEAATPSETRPLTSDCESDGSEEHELYLKPAPQHALPKEDGGLCTVPEGLGRQCLWLVSLPIKTLLAFTVPDCREERWRKWFWVTFSMSLVWLSFFSFIMVWMITVIGFTVNIPDTVMGLTLVAFGVSLPDVVASVLVVKEGLGDMAVSNAIGSNVFDILVCLGVPWLLKNIVQHDGEIQVYSSGLTYSSITLMSTVAFLLIATHINGWKLNRKFGAILLVVYVLYTILASLYELNIFGYFHPPECPSNY